jgi:Fe2+ transport system protein FeoA
MKRAMMKQHKQHNEHHQMRLSQVAQGRTVRLVDIEAGQGLRSRLTAMGIARNVRLRIINNSHPGPFVVSAKGCKIMLGRGMAHHLWVVEDKG